MLKVLYGLIYTIIDSWIDKFLIFIIKCSDIDDYKKHRLILTQD